MKQIEDIRNFLMSQEFFIYGAGYIANRFYKVLKNLRLHENIRCFVVSKKENGMDDLNGHKIISVDELNKQSHVCIAVHETLKEEIEIILESKGIHNYIWISPYLVDLQFGLPLEAGILVPTSQLVNICKDYRLAIRQLAIENYFHLNRIGDDIYIKAQQFWCDKNTAQKRLAGFKKLIGSFNNSGYNPSNPIIIDTDYRIMDGAHRISCARYFGTKNVVCNIYNRTEEYSNWMGNSTLNTDVIHSGYFSPEEIHIIEDAYLRIQ